MFQFYESEQADLLPLDLDTVRCLCDTASLGHVHFVCGLSSHVFGPLTAVRFLSPLSYQTPRGRARNFAFSRFIFCLLNDLAVCANDASRSQGRLRGNPPALPRRARALAGGTHQASLPFGVIYAVGVATVFVAPTTMCPHALAGAHTHLSQSHHSVVLRVLRGRSCVL